MVLCRGPTGVGMGLGSGVRGLWGSIGPYRTLVRVLGKNQQTCYLSTRSMSSQLTEATHYRPHGAENRQC